MDKKAGGEAEPEAMRLHIINSCLFALDPSIYYPSWGVPQIWVGGAISREGRRKWGVGNLKLGQ